MSNGFSPGRPPSANSHTLVTGATGFIGHSLTRRLVDEGRRVVTVIRDEGPSLVELPAAVTRVRGDICDAALCKRVLADYEVEYIHHLASHSIVSACADDPVSALHTNVMGTAHLFEAARSVGRLRAAVVSTSDKVYGVAEPPYDEETPLDAHHAYEVSKACQDLTSRLYRYNYKLPVAVVRAVNVFGPGDPNATRLVPRTIQRLLRGEKPVVHDGAYSMERQFLYVDDMVDALLRVEGVVAAGAGKPAYCVPGHGPFSVGEVIEQIRQLMDRDVSCVVGQRRLGFEEITRQWIESDVLAELGWEMRTDFVTGLQQTIDWYSR